jgi:hypothetical protein
MTSSEGRPGHTARERDPARSTQHAGEHTLEEMPNDAALRAELLEMLETAHDAGALRAHGERLWEILDDYEVWPGRRLVGEDGSRAAWLVAQFALDDPGLQKRCLEAIDNAVAYGDADPVHAAYLLDRVRMADGLDQLYGSQFVLDANGDLVPWPVDDEVAVEGRRQRLGLPPFAEHAAAMRARWAERRGQAGSDNDVSSAARQQYHAATDR